MPALLCISSKLTVVQVGAQWDVQQEQIHVRHLAVNSQMTLGASEVLLHSAFCSDYLAIVASQYHYQLGLIKLPCTLLQHAQACHNHLMCPLNSAITLCSHAAQQKVSNGTIKAT